MTRRSISSALLLISMGMPALYMAWCQTPTFDPSTKIVIDIQPTITFEKISSQFTYAYKIISKPSSIQKVWSFDVTLASSAAANILSPSSWNSLFISRKQTINWSSNDSAAFISPGNSLSGFSLRSVNPPGLAISYAQGFVGTLPQVDHVTENLPSPPDPYQDAITTMTVGPVVISSSLTVSDLIDNIVALKHQSVALGWLRGEEFVVRLDRKLDQAKKALSKGHDFQARNKLQEFIHELSEERERQVRESHKEDKEKPNEHSEEHKSFVNDNAFYLLKSNAEFVISKLPLKAKNDDDRDSDNP